MPVVVGVLTGFRRPVAFQMLAVFPGLVAFRWPPANRAHTASLVDQAGPAGRGR